jgi:predicted Zn-dependent peptidase
VYSYPAAFDDTGAFAVSAGTAPKRVDELLGVFEAQLERLVADGGVNARELDTAKGHLMGSMALSFESSGSRMRRLGAAELMLGEVLTLDELVERTAAVTPEDVARVVERVVATEERVLAIVGPFDEGRFSNWAG